MGEGGERERERCSCELVQHLHNMLAQQNQTVSYDPVSKCFFLFQMLPHVWQIKSINR